jgi:hypothetical protein
MSLRVEPLAALHERVEFSCAREPKLEAFFRERALSESEKGVSRCFVLVDEERDPTVPLGFYTLSASSIMPADVAELRVMKLPRYPMYPVVLLGRMARDDRATGRLLGTTLLWNAFDRSIAAMETIGAIGMIVKAKNADLVKWYKRHGFSPFVTEPLDLFIDRRAIRTILTEAGQEDFGSAAAS